MTVTTPQLLMLTPGETMPNSPLPVLIYRALGPLAFGEIFTRHGWVGLWRSGIYEFDHYHSNAHEALGVLSGRATLQLGGDEGEAVEVSAGDALVLPAGTGHRRISRSADFLVAGAYPRGQDSYDLCRSRNPEAELRISKVALPQTDPVHGADGPLIALWR